MKDKVFIVADYFISKNREDKKGLTNKKLQKLLYYAQAWNLVLHNKKLFQDDIQAWIHGPAIPRVYGQFKQFGFRDIESKISSTEFSNLLANEKKLLDTIWDIYGKYDANYLEVLTHSEAPWQDARRETEADKSSNAIISSALMKEYYGRQIQK